ncbi:MAG: NAD(P)/FAD-dependent oxidoreductase [Phycisphaeraceae bacterium]
MSDAPCPLDLEQRTDRPRVVVVGCGFGGLAFCKRFRADADVVLLDRQNHHLFQPLLYQVAMAGLSGPDIAAPVRSIFRKRRNIETHLAEVESVDLDRKRVRIETGELGYDCLVFAAGGKTNYFGNEHWRGQALGLKTLEDAMAIRRRVLTSFERAESNPDPDETRRLMTIVVVGGGPTGVELAGAMAELAKRVFRGDFRHIEPSQTRVILVEGTDRVLNMYPPKRSDQAKRQLESLGVEVQLGKFVTEVHDDRVVLSDGECIETRNVLWGTGVVASDVVESFGDVPRDKFNRVQVEPDLSIPGYPDAFVIGDAAAVFQRDGTPVPGLAPAAMQMGKYVADRLSARLRGRTPPPKLERFDYLDKGAMATIGRTKAVAQIRRFGFAGLPAWLLWVTIHLFFLVSFRNKLVVFIKWVTAYYQYQRGARIIYDPQPHDEADVLHDDPPHSTDSDAPRAGEPRENRSSHHPDVETDAPAPAGPVAHPT